MSGITPRTTRVPLTFRGALRGPLQTTRPEVGRRRGPECRRAGIRVPRHDHRLNYGSTGRLHRQEDRHVKSLASPACSSGIELEKTSDERISRVGFLKGRGRVRGAWQPEQKLRVGRGAAGRWARSSPSPGGWCLNDLPRLRRADIGVRPWASRARTCGGEEAGGT